MNDDDESGWGYDGIDDDAEHDLFISCLSTNESQEQDLGVQND